MREFNQLMSSVARGDFVPFYLLTGTEPYFIDHIEAEITGRLIDEASRPFDYSLFYGKEAEAYQIVETAKRFPLLSSHHLVVVREAQHLEKSTDIIADYLSNPQPSTILVFCHKYKAFDKRKKLYKEAKKTGVVFESKPLYDNELSPWITEKVKASNSGDENNERFSNKKTKGSKPQILASKPSNKSTRKKRNKKPLASKIYKSS